MYIVALLVILSTLLSAGAVKSQAAVSSGWPVVAADERLLLDMTVRTLPEQSSGMCILVEPGILSATVQLVGETALPTRFRFHRINHDTTREAAIFTPVATVPVTHTIPIGEGLWCYGVENETAASRTMIPGPLQTQYVAVRMTWSPPAP